MPAIEITTTIPCKNMCVYCPQSMLLKKYGRQDLFMTFDILKQCLSTIPKNVEVHFSGYSECFLNQLCTSFINYVLDSGYSRIILYTTLVGLKYEQITEIQHVPFETMCLHLPDNNGYMKCKVDDEYIRVINKFLDTFPQCKSIVCYGPLHEKLVPIIKNYHSGVLHSRANNLTNIPKNIRLVGKIGCGATGCTRPLNRVELLPNGNVSLCCMDYGLKHIIGNLLTDTWENPFKSEAYKYIEQGLDDDTLDILCRTCQEAITIYKKNNTK